MEEKLTLANPNPNPNADSNPNPNPGCNPNRRQAMVIDRLSYDKCCSSPLGDRAPRCLEVEGRQGRIVLP